MSIEQAIKGLDTLGERLRIERERLGWTQDEMASFGAVSCPSQKLYEYSKRTPSLHYLYLVSKAGADDVHAPGTGRRIRRDEHGHVIRSEKTGKIETESSAARAGVLPTPPAPAPPRTHRAARCPTPTS